MIIIFTYRCVGGSMTFKKLFSFLFLTLFFASNTALFSATTSVRVVAISLQKIIAHRHWNQVFGKIAHGLRQVPLREVPEVLMITGKTLTLHFRGREISLQALIQQYPLLANYEQMIYEVATMATYNQDVIALLKKLKENDVILVLASNTSADLIDYLKENNADVFGLFDLFCIGTDKDGKKPSVQYFTKLRDMINNYAMLSNEDAIVLVDFSEKNVKTAMECSDLNIQALQFSSAQELEEELTELGYL